MKSKYNIICTFTHVLMDSGRFVDEVKKMNLITNNMYILNLLDILPVSEPL